MKIAIASSGLGHVARGIETWAEDLANALVERDVDVTLFAAAELPRKDERGNLKPERRVPPVVVIECLKRGDALTRRLTALTPGFIWRWGLKNPYGWEQLSFWLHLWPILRSGQFDILHVQDPMVASWCRRFRRMGLLGTKEILAHGTEESADFLRQFDYVQHLAPWHLDKVLASFRTKKESALRIGVNRQSSIGNHQYWTAIPNFVDTDIFRPVKDSHEKAVIRERMGIPGDGFVVGTVAAVKRTHKRIDHLIREFAAFQSQCSEIGDQKSEVAQDGRSTLDTPTLRHSGTPTLLIAGARTDESDELIRMANELIPGRVKIMLDIPRADMAQLYRAMDVFVLASLFEMMPIALIEAMASGIPVIVNHHPVLEWISGKSGACVDMAEKGALAREIRQFFEAGIGVQRGNAVRQRAVDMFSKDVVVEQIAGMYEEVMMK